MRLKGEVREKDVFLKFNWLNVYRKFQQTMLNIKLVSKRSLPEECAVQKHLASPNCVPGLLF